MLGRLKSNMQENEVGPLAHIIYKINSKCNKDLNLKANYKILNEKNIGVNRYVLGFGNGFQIWHQNHKSRLNNEDTKSEET